MSTQERSTHADPHAHPYSRIDLNHAFSKGHEDGYERGYNEGAAYARAEIIAFLALGGTFRGLTDNIGFWTRLKCAYYSFMGPARIMQSANKRAAQFLQGGE